MPFRCPNCQTDLEEGARFCGACGRKLAPSELGGAAAPARPMPALGSGAVAGVAPARPMPATGSGAVTGAAPAVRGPGISPAAAPPAGSGAMGTGKARAPLRSLDALVGRTLNNRYLVDRKIGEGGFGAVFKGKQLATGREVALKILHPHNVSDQTVVARFRREAEACSKLRNPHTVTTYDFDETEDGVLYLAMEFLRGKSLHDLQRAERVIAPDRVLRIIAQVSESLGEAHELGIVHRDMKPENVVVEVRPDGTDLVKVLDFGIAKVISGDAAKGAALTAVGQTLGTLEFMSPEQLRGQKIDGRSDIYALGMMAYEMLTGELPFKNAKSPTQIIQFHMQEVPLAPSAMNPALKIPAYVDEIVLKMVAKAADDRYENAAALRARIVEVLEHDHVTKFEAYRVVGVVGAVVAVIAGAIYLLSR